MNRLTILEATKQAATAQGYTFYADSGEYMRSTVKSLPALWLTSPKFISMQGRNHGKVTYEVVMHVIDMGVKFAPTERNEEWTRTEEELLEIFSRISQHEKVASVNNIVIRFADDASSIYGQEIATATAEVVTLF